MKKISIIYLDQIGRQLLFRSNSFVGNYLVNNFLITNYTLDWTKFFILSQSAPARPSWPYLLEGQARARRKNDIRGRPGYFFEKF